MTTINAVTETGIEDLARRLSLSDFEFAEFDDEQRSQKGSAIDDDALAELIHDIRNTIGAVAMLSELTSLELPENSNLRAMTSNVQQACHDAGAQCERILVACRGLPAKTELTDLSTLVRGMAPLLATWIPPASVLRFNLESDLPRVELTPTDIRQLVMNLVKNAAEAIGNRPGIVTVSTGWSESGAGGLSDCDGCKVDPVARSVCLAVSDTGCGMDEPTRAGLQTKHYSSKSNGHGLGLASVRRIVAAHEARLLITSRFGAGTMVRVAFGGHSTVADDVSIGIHDVREPSVAMDEIRVLPLSQAAASYRRQAAPVRTTRAQRLRLCGAELMAVDAQH